MKVQKTNIQMDVVPNPPIGISVKGYWHTFKDYLFLRRRLIHIDPVKNIKKFYEIRVYQSYPLYKPMKYVKDPTSLLGSKPLPPELMAPTWYVIETTYGRIGTTGKSDDGGVQATELDKEIARMVTAKIKKGYVEEV